MTRACRGKARFAFPPDLARTGVDPSQMDMSRAELRFGLSDPRGLGANPRVNVGGKPLRLQPGGGSGGGRGFFAWVDATGLLDATIAGRLRLRLPRQCVAEPCPAGGRHALDACIRPGRARASAAISCPSARPVSDKGFDATYRIGNLALGRSLVSTGDAGASHVAAAADQR